MTLTTAQRLAAIGLEDYGPPPSVPGPVLAAVAQDELGSSWEPVDTAAVLEGLASGTITRPTPTVLSRTDRTALLYAGRVNGIAGASGEAKSLVAQHACAQEMTAGAAVIYVDLEDDAPSVLSRLLAMGVDAATIAARFVYVTPDEAYGGDARDRLEALVVLHAPTLVVVDSTGESLALDGARPNDDDDVARWFRRLPGAIARLGPAVLVIDHMAKADDGQLSPIGSQRKRAAIGGAQYITSMVRPFDRQTPGMVKLICGKDRSGTFRRGQVVAEVQITPGDDDNLTVELEAPASGDGDAFRPSCLMERVSRHLEDADEPQSRNAIRDAVSGSKPGIVRAISVLVAEGYLERSTEGQAHLHRSLKPYREDLG